jgi:hypothetical protein
LVITPFFNIAALASHDDVTGYVKAQAHPVHALEMLDVALVAIQFGATITTL